MGLVEFDDTLFELEQTTATLGFMQTVFAEGSSMVDNDESAAVIYMLYRKQNDILQKLRKILESNTSKS